jgi:hypothetical protein
MKKMLMVLVLFIAQNSIAQNSCFTNCMNFQSNNPNGGAICSTNCGGGAGVSSQGLNVGAIVGNGYAAGAAIRQDQNRNESINRAKTDCNNGIAAGCDYLKRNNIY